MLPAVVSTGEVSVPEEVPRPPRAKGGTRAVSDLSPLSERKVSDRREPSGTRVVRRTSANLLVVKTSGAVQVVSSWTGGA